MKVCKSTFNYHFIKPRKIAFTLAEALITLGIIGVVAALTIPSLMADHRKKEITVRLKQDYSILAQTMLRAQADHGEMGFWDGLSSSGALADNEGNQNNAKSDVNVFFTKYVKPYVKIVKDFGFAQSSEVYGSNNGPYNVGTGEAVSESGYYFALSNGSIIRMFFGTSGCVEDEDGNCTTDVTYTTMVFKVDVNGLKKPNMEGKDIFLMAVDSEQNKFVMHNYGQRTRSEYRTLCSDASNNVQVCGYLIQLDGWEIKPDYPWY